MSLRPEQKLALEAKLRAYVGIETGPPEAGPDLVNEAMIRHWCEAMGDRSPVYTNAEAAKSSVHGGIVAPPTMLQAWILRGIEMADPSALDADKQRELHRLLGEHGYTSVVATNCEQRYHRYLRPGDQVTATTRIEAISEEKATALGIGYFIDTRTTFSDQRGDEVGWMTFRVLKFRPAQPPAAASAEPAGGAPARPTRLRPPLGFDNAWWWEGVERGVLLIQKCGACGVLRHPPAPMCGRCQSLEWTGVEASGRGTVHSYTVLHHPRFPGYEYPMVVVLVDLEEGTRLVSNLLGCAPDQVRIGMPVRLSMEDVDEATRLPIFRPAQSEPAT